jgi:hypothetical protein
MSYEQVTKVKELALQIGIDTNLFEGWDGHEIALYRVTGGSSHSYEVARQQMIENARVETWVLDLGNRSVGLPPQQARALKQKLADANITVQDGSLAQSYMARALRSAARHDDVLRELAKR